jgi:hypothetical protein
LELRDEKRGEIVNYMDFDRHLIGQRNAEMLREVRALRLEGQLRKNRRARSGERTPPHPQLDLAGCALVGARRGLLRIAHHHEERMRNEK